MDITSLLKASDLHESSIVDSASQNSNSGRNTPLVAFVPTSTVATTAAPAPTGHRLYSEVPRIGPAPRPPNHPITGSSGGGGGKRGHPSAHHSSPPPAKKQQKWSPEEDALIIELRGGGMKWDDISKRLSHRSPISCRLHYQNYLEKRSDWDDERKTKLARLYDRLKPEMWAKVADEMAIPWRAVEAMHWQLGEQEMARRAGVTPFALASTDNLQQQQQQQQQHQGSSSGASSSRPHHRGHGHSRSQGSIFRETIDPSSRSSYGRTVIPPLPPGPSPGPPPSRTLGPIVSSRTEPPPAHLPIMHSEQPNEPPGYSHTAGGPLAPIQTQNSQSRPGMLPGLAELTTGVSPYSTPAYSVGAPTVSPAQSSTASPGPYFPAMTYPPLVDAASSSSSTSKRRRSPEYAQPESSRRRHMESGFEQSIPRHMP